MTEVKTKTGKIVRAFGDEVRGPPIRDGHSEYRGLVCGHEKLVAVAREILAALDDHCPEVGEERYWNDLRERLRVAVGSTAADGD